MNKERIDYVYDGSFQGFLCCVFLHYRKTAAAGIYQQDAYQRDILTNYEIVATCDEQAEIVYKAIQEKISDHDLKRAYSAFCSNDVDKEMKILRYLIRGFKQGPGIRLLHSDSDVFEVVQLERRVNLEVHRMCGLVRFIEMRAGEYSDYRHSQDERQQKKLCILYAPIEPDNDIIEFLAPHFVDRLKEETFIIHDKKRDKALVYTSNDWYITDFKDEGLMRQTKAEEGYKQLWQLYFDTIAIRERTNPACQKRMMPVRYWSNLAEFARKYDDIISVK